MNYSQILGHLSINSAHFPLLHNLPGYIFLACCSCCVKPRVLSSKSVENKFPSGVASLLTIKNRKGVLPQSVAKSYYY
jgi:hypothetical protein